MGSREEQQERWREHVEELKRGPKAPYDSYSRHLKSFQPTADRLQQDLKDSAPNRGGTSRRKLHGQEITVPLAGQPSLMPDEGVEIQTQTAADGLTSQQPKDKPVQDAVEGFAVPKNLTRANRQRWAITRNTLRRAEQQSRGIETPSED